eukprot:6010717-Amphidinium_carterae.1
MRENADGHLLQLDIAKCFNNINTADAIRMLRHFGLHPSVCQLLSTHYEATRVRNKLSPTWASEHFAFERGCAQGCPISVTLANLVLSLIPDLSDPDITCVMFMDDTS